MLFCIAPLCIFMYVNIHVSVSFILTWMWYILCICEWHIVIVPTTMIEWLNEFYYELNKWCLFEWFMLYSVSFATTMASMFHRIIWYIWYDIVWFHILTCFCRDIPSYLPVSNYHVHIFLHCNNCTYNINSIMQYLMHHPIQIWLTVVLHSIDNPNVCCELYARCMEGVLYM